MLDGSVTHLFVSEQILLDNRYTRHDRSEIVSPTQVVRSASLLLDIDCTSHSQRTALRSTKTILLNMYLEAQTLVQIQKGHIRSAYQEA